MGFGKEIKDFISAFKTGALTMQQKQQYELQKAHYAALEQYYDAQIKANQNGHEPDVSHIIEQGRNSAGGIPPVARTPGINPSQTSAIDTGDNPYLGRQMAAESGGRDYDANGNVLTSSAGAKGRMQVLDSTNSDPGYGVAPARDASVE